MIADMRFFSGEFVKTFRLSLSLTEIEMAEILGISLERYLAFEKSPVACGGMDHARFLGLLNEVAGPAWCLEFSTFLEFDALSSVGVIDIFSRMSPRAVKTGGSGKSI